MIDADCNLQQEVQRELHKRKLFENECEAEFKSVHGLTHLNFRTL